MPDRVRDISDQCQRSFILKFIPTVLHQAKELVIKASYGSRRMRLSSTELTDHGYIQICTSVYVCMVYNDKLISL